MTSPLTDFLLLTHQDPVRSLVLRGSLLGLGVFGLDLDLSSEQQQRLLFGKPVSLRAGADPEVDDLTAENFSEAKTRILKL